MIIWPGGNHLPCPPNLAIMTVLILSRRAGPSMQGSLCGFQVPAGIPAHFILPVFSTPEKGEKKPKKKENSRAAKNSFLATAGYWQKHSSLGLPGTYHTYLYNPISECTYCASHSYHPFYKHVEISLKTAQGLCPSTVLGLFPGFIPLTVMYIMGLTPAMVNL